MNMDDKAPEAMFTLKCILKNLSVNLYSGIEYENKQFIALTTRNDQVVLYYINGELPPVIKKMSWFSKPSKAMQAICFDVTATWLLVACADGSLYILPALSLVDKKQKIDCKWYLNDLTHFPKHTKTPDDKPTCIVWWQTLECNQNAIVGYENGAIALISLTDGRCLGICAITERVIQMHLCQDTNTDTTFLLVNGESGQQWRLTLEQSSTTSSWNSELKDSQDSSYFTMYSLKQLGVNKFTSLKQRFMDKKRNSDDLSYLESAWPGPELLSCLSDTSFTPQDSKLFSAHYKPTSLVTIHEANFETAPLYVHKLSTDTDLVFFHHKLIYTVNYERDIVSVVSARLSECRMEGDTEFNPEALLTHFKVRNESILYVYKFANLSVNKLNEEIKSDKEKYGELNKNVSEIFKLALGSCIVITDKSVYKIINSYSPVHQFIYYITKENNFQKAEKVALVFSLNLQLLLEYCGDLLTSTGSFHSGIVLYKQAKVHLLKRLLKVAISADCKTMLKFVHLCLNTSRIDMSMATKIHIGNLAVMGYTELILRYGGKTREAHTKEFLSFLRYEEFYDQILAVNVICQAGHWNILFTLATSRGLQQEVVAAFGQILRSSRAPRPNNHDFLMAISEPSLAQSLSINSQSSEAIFQYIRLNIEYFPVDILQRFVIQLDPSQPCLIPRLKRTLRGVRYASSYDTSYDMADVNECDKSMTITKGFIETFLTVLIHLISRSDKAEYDVKLLQKIEIDEEVASPKSSIEKLPNLCALSCGFEHAAVIRNCCLYTMGVSSSGCLGLGPLLIQSSPPKLVSTLAELKLKVLSVSCGKKHTLVLTDYGVYAWGSNVYGQLGIGENVHDSPYPQLVKALCYEKVVQVVAGQYHSIALVSTGRIYTWGWGIYGQLGHGNCENLFYPKLFDFGGQIVQVAAGHAHSLVLTSEGKLFGFGSNVFGQLENCQINSNKTNRPTWVMLTPEIYVPIESISSAYFHNVAVRADQEVYIWGASPQEIRSFHAKNTQNARFGDSWKFDARSYFNVDKSPIEEVSVGYRHMALLHNGEIVWSKNKNNELGLPKLKSKNDDGFYSSRFLHVACGFDYTMAVDRSGRLYAWGNNSIAQILGKSSSSEDNRIEGKIVMFKNTKRIVKFSNDIQVNSENTPIEISGLPAMNITYDKVEDNLFIHYTPHSVLNVENSHTTAQILKTGQNTLHYALETYYGLYDTESILLRCLSVNNFQAASKICLLNDQFTDSLGFQIAAFRKHVSALNSHLDINYPNNRYTYMVEQEQKFVDLVVRNIKKDFDSRANSAIFHVDDLQKNNIVNCIEQSGSTEPNVSIPLNNQIIETATCLVEFYIKKVYTSENNVLMQKVLAKCIEFWLISSFPVPILEEVLLKNIDKYCHPLAILLFCKSASEEPGETNGKTQKKPQRVFTKEFSTKFCVNLCSMTLEIANKS